MNGDPFEFVSVDSDFAVLQNSLGIPVHIEQSAFWDRLRKDPHNDSLKNNVRTMQEDSGQQLEEISNFDTPDFDDDETVVAPITPGLRDIVLHQAHDPRSQAKRLNSGDNA